MNTSIIKVNDAGCVQLEPLLKIEDLERLFRVNRRTIARWVKNGQVPAPFKLGGSNRWKGEAIASLLDRQDGQES